MHKDNVKALRSVTEIKEYLPHKYPFLLVDRVVELEVGKYIKGFKNLTVNEEFFNGHFPTEPVMPGALIIEALAQISGILGCETVGTKPGLDGNIHYLAGVNKVKFKNKVVPGDRLYLKSKLVRTKRGFWQFACEAKVEDNLCCTAEILTVEK